MSSETGVTLAELLILLVLAGVTVHAVIAPLRHQADLHAVRAAREELVALVSMARAHAAEHGRAMVVVDEGSDPYVRGVGDADVGRARLSDRGVRIEVLGSRSGVTLEYGPLGIATFASASLALSRRGAVATVVVSSYGRVRR